MPLAFTPQVVLLLDLREQFGRSAGQGAAAAREGHMATVRGDARLAPGGARLPAGCGLVQPLGCALLADVRRVGHALASQPPPHVLGAMVLRRCGELSCQWKAGRCPSETPSGWPAAGAAPL